jgi:hypothetical protein
MKLISPAYQILEEQRISARNAEVNKQNNSPAISKRQKRINRSKSSHSLLMKMIAVGRYLQKKKLVKSCTDSKIEIARQAAIDLNLSLPDILSKKRAEPIIEQAYSILKNSNRLPEKPVKKHNTNRKDWLSMNQESGENCAIKR